MGTIVKTILLSEQQDDWINAQIELGVFANASECIQNLIERDIEALRAALIEGEESGGAMPFDLEEFKLRMRKLHG